MTVQIATGSRPDQRTVTAIGQALAAARSGRLEEACDIAERALASGGDPVAINALLGMIRFDLGDNDQAVRNLDIAHEARPSDIKIATNLANALVALKRYDRALEVATRDLAFADPTLQLARIRGFVADQLHDFAAAIEALQHVVAAAPDDWESWNNLGNAHRGAEAWEASATAHERAAAINPSSPMCRINYAHALLECGRTDEGEAGIRQIIQDFKDDTQSLRELHSIFKNMMRDEEALETINAAIAREPDNLELLLAKATHLSSMHRMDASEAAYRRMIELDSLNGSAYLGLASNFDLTNRDAELASLAQEAKEKGVKESVVDFIRASQLRRVKQFDAGLAAIEKVPDDLDTPRKAHLLAQLLDGAERYDDAFAAFTHMNQLFADDPTMPEVRAERYRETIKKAPTIVTEDWVRSWRTEPEPDPRPAPMFLVGFPRSGTTLLDTILMSHPRIEVLEEEPAIKKAIDLLGDVPALPTASDEQIKAARDAYFECAATLTPLTSGNLLIDKNPLTMNLLPQVRRIFPEARVILALRHPCDVVLSCFMANFRLNDGMANFLRLDTAAELYDASFRYYEHVQELTPFPTHTVVYENVVADRETELRKLFDFLGLDWHDAVLDHQKTARERGRIKTASYAQVVEPIYTRSAGRWQNYRKHLEPVFPILKPWVEKFGYSL